MSLSEWNERQIDKYGSGIGISKNNIQCPECGEEMYDGDKRMVVATYPPKHKIFCKGCGYTDFKIF